MPLVEQEPHLCNPNYAELMLGVFIRVIYKSKLMSIPGLCKLWCRSTTGPNQYWVAMSYAARDYFACQQLGRLYQENFPDMEYRITANSDMCRPVS